MSKDITSVERYRLLEVAKYYSPQAANLLQGAWDERVARDPGESELTLWTADEILEREWPEPVWVIPGILPAGLAILGGLPKVGKSRLSLQMALAVATGGEIFGVQVRQGPVLYLHLEEDPRWLQQDMKMLGWPKGLPVRFMWGDDFAREIGDLGGRGSEKLAREIERGEYLYTIVDTFSNAFRGDQNSKEEMTNALGPSRAITYTYACTMQLNDHHTKGFKPTPDAVLDVLGSVGKPAMANTIMGLYKKKERKSGKLVVTGHRTPGRVLSIYQDPDTGFWGYEGEAETVELTIRQQEILGALQALGPLKAADVAKAVEQDRSNTYSRLRKLVNDGYVLEHTMGGDVCYLLPSQERRQAKDHKPDPLPGFEEGQNDD